MLKNATELFYNNRSMPRIQQNSPLEKGVQGVVSDMEKAQPPLSPFLKGESNREILCSANNQISNRNGFTLIEVIVVIGIMAIIVGMMIPFFYRVIESTEIELTKQRISDLKKAMVGDSRMIQNGIRTNFGYVGDNGQLPASISDALPYMPSGYDTGKYSLDAWGNPIVYTPVTVSGRRVSATLKSSGPDGILGGLSTDDLDEITTHTNYTSDALISESEVTPTNAVQGNLNFVYTSATGNVPSYSAKLRATYKLDGSDTAADSDCIILDATTIPVNVATLVSQSFSRNFAVKLPIGKVRISSILFYTATDCSGSSRQSTNEISLFVSDGLNTIFVNAPTINYTIP